jgi:hypothetical protein
MRLMVSPNRAGSTSPAGKPVPAGNPAPYAARDSERGRNARTRADLPDVLDALSVRYVILDLKSDGDLHQIMRSQPRWFVDFEDGEGAVFARASGARA